MILTGKALEDFLIWCKKRCNIKLHELSKMEYWFTLQDIAFQNALIIEWFDKKSIYIVIHKGIKVFTVEVKGNGYVTLFNDHKRFENRQEDIVNGIIKANKYYNERT